MHAWVASCACAEMWQESSGEGLLLARAVIRPQLPPGGGGDAG
jgi:hypothetical protein